MFEEYKLTDEERLIYKWQYNLFGDFYKNLMKAVCVADQSNLNCLALGYPELISGYQKYAHEHGWFERVVQKHDGRFDIQLIEDTDIDKLPLIINDIQSEIGKECLSKLLQSKEV